jgi:predicted lipoprotein with Yx(FWY)xxD motif
MTHKGLGMVLHLRSGAWLLAAAVSGSLAFLSSQAFAEIETPPAPDQFVLVEKGHGWVITDSNQMTLYMSKSDTDPGKSNCVNDCIETWRPYLAAEDAVTGDGWSVIKRIDEVGTEQVERLQWAYNDKPLYTYSVDQGPGDTYGDGIGLLWDIAFIAIPTPPGIQIEKTLLGHVAADRHQRTLYTPEDDVDVASLCLDSSCLDVWRPMLAPRVARSFGDWQIVTRRDGLKQWAYQGHPLFHYENDVQIREFAGHGAPLDANGRAMAAMILEPRPPYPDWVTVQDTDAGEMLGDENYKTIYTWDPSKLRGNLAVAAEGCEFECLEDEWIPILAEEGDVAPGGNWAILTLSDGRRQWAYKGRRLFTNTRDTTQGSFLGYRHGGNRAWNVVMHSGDALQGTLRRP